MMTRYSAAEVTLKGKADALGPNNAELPTSNSEVRDNISALTERSLQFDTPEAQQQFEIEQHALDQWLVFRIKPAIVRHIVEGDSTDLDTNEIYSDVVKPELVSEQVAHLTLAASITGKSIPELQERLDNVTEQKTIAESDLKMALAEKDKDYPSLRLIKNIPLFKDIVTRRARDHKDLTQDIENHTLRAHTHEAMFAYIDRTLKYTPEPVLLDMTENLAFEAKKLALQEVLDVYTERLDTMHATLSEGGAIDTIEYTKLPVRIAALQEELNLLSTVSFEEYRELQVAEQAEALSEMKAVAKQWPVETVKKFGSLILNFAR